MAKWVPELERLLNLMFSREVAPNTLCRCGAAGSVRCQECDHNRYSCRECLIEDHIRQPLHWVEEWNGQYFAKHSLSAIGGVFFFGHDGAICPHTPTSHQGKSLSMTILHTNGVHSVHVSWCHCPGAGDRVDQLMKIGWFPATLNKPETAFTFKLLDEFQIHHLQSKKSAYDYFLALVRLTNGQFPSDVAVSSSNHVKIC